MIFLSVRGKNKMNIEKGYVIFKDKDTGEGHVYQATKIHGNQFSCRTEQSLVGFIRH